MLAIVADLDGEIIGYGGLIYRNGQVAAVMDMKPDAARLRVSIHRAGKMLLALARRRGIAEVVALRDPNYGTSDRWLSRLGFEPVADTSDGEVWLWRQQSLT